MRNKILRNKMLVMATVFVAALFIGTSMSTVLASEPWSREDQKNWLREQEENSNNDGTDEKEDEGCVLCAIEKAARTEEELKKVDEKSREVSSTLTKAISSESFSGDDEVMALLRIIADEVVAIRKDVTALREEVRALSGMQVEKSYTFDELFKTQEEKEAVAAYLLGFSEAAPHITEYRKLSAEQQKSNRLSSAIKFEQMALTAETQEEKDSYESTYLPDMLLKHKITLSF